MDPTEPTVQDDREYLTEVVPACSPIEGTSINPCDEESIAPFGWFHPGGGLSIWNLPEPVSIRTFLDGDSHLSPTHMVVRGTFIEDSVRCTSELFRPPSFLDPGLAAGHEGIFKCFADLQVREYIVGAGPSTLTLWLDHIPYARVIAHSGYNDVIAEEEAPWGEAEAWYLRGFAGRFTGELLLSPVSIFNREQIHFIGPGYDEGTVTWRRNQTLDVEQDEDDNPYVAHPHRDLYEQGDPDYYTQHRTSLEIPLATFRTEVAAQQQARIQEYGGLSFSSTDPELLEGASPPTLISNAHNVNDYYVEVGAYDHADGPPKSPPADCHGTAVPEGRDNIWLVHACIKLLEGMDTLRGTAELNWSTDLAITAWDGITTGSATDDGLGDRLTQLDLSDEDLDGSIPAELGRLYTLTALKLNDNDLTGHIPAELAELTELTELKLAGNDFAGCIPEELSDVADNDLDDLGLADCMPVPEPTTIGSDEVRFTSVHVHLLHP